MRIGGAENGELYRVQVGFLEMELATGILQLTCDAQKVALFIRGGRILDVESDHPGSATEALRSLLEWQDGTFEFRFQEIERDDVIEKATAWLLLDLAHRADQADEASSGG